MFLRFFYFTRGERNALLLLGLIFLAGLLWFYFQYFYPAEKAISEEEREAFLEKVESFREQAREKQRRDSLDLQRDMEQSPDQHVHHKAQQTQEPEYFYFDPNEVSEREMEKLGFSSKEIRAVKNYRSAGGRFCSPEDLEAMYTVSAGTYQRVKEWIRIEGDLCTADQFSKEPYTPKGDVCINTADSLQLQEVPGIGTVFSQRIVRYRALLGGFYNVYQLGEVYGIDTSYVEELKPYLTIKDSALDLVDINNVSGWELGRHPYIEHEEAEIIVSYRDQHGQFETAEDLYEIAVIDTASLKNIRPYIHLTRQE